jgi:hypothetical protein
MLGEQDVVFRSTCARAIELSNDGSASCERPLASMVVRRVVLNVPFAMIGSLLHGLTSENDWTKS